MDIGIILVINTFMLTAYSILNQYKLGLLEDKIEELYKELKQKQYGKNKN